MSELVVEVCQIENIQPHPNADRLEIVKVKGWQICAQIGTFSIGQKVVYFPPDSILPSKLANGPEDDPPGRLNCIKYLKSLPKNEDGERPDGGRVCAARLRGHPSFGVIMPIDISKGDKNWKVGTDVSKFFGITKYEPPQKTSEGDAAPENIKFFKYASPEHYANYPDWIKENELVTITEKVHGKNCRLGLILNANEEGEASWDFMAGSHSVNRKQFSNVINRFNTEELNLSNIELDQIIKIYDNNWKIIKIKENNDNNEKIYFHAIKLDKNNEPVQIMSEFWEVMNDNIKSLLTHIKDNFEYDEEKYSIILYGEIYGSGVQDMTYGLSNGQKQFVAFDISINGKYINWDNFKQLTSQFNVPTVIPLYSGPFKESLIDEYTSGKTVMCDPSQAGKFKGREGIVIKPQVEKTTFLGKRIILKSVSVDYLSRSEGTEYH